MFFKHLQLNLSLAISAHRSPMTCSPPRSSLSLSRSAFQPSRDICSFRVNAYLQGFPPGMNCHILRRVGGKIPKPLASNLVDMNPSWKDSQEIEGPWTSEKIFTKQVGQMICWLRSRRCQLSLGKMQMYPCSPPEGPCSTLLTAKVRRPFI